MNRITEKQSLIGYFLSIFLVISVMFLSGCSKTKTGAATKVAPNTARKTISSPKAKTNYGSIAIYDINIKHPTARLVYKNENVRDRITRGLQTSKGFKVIDWARLDDVLFRRNIEKSDLIVSEAVRREVGEILLNDYFLQGTVTSYGERMEFASSAFSKQKTQVVDVELELFVKDALTNEVVASANGRGATSKAVSQTLGFGAAGGNDTVAANKALNLAVDDAIGELLAAMETVPARESKPVSGAEKYGPGDYLKQPKVKVLFILAETEERLDHKIIKNSNSDSFTSSIVENAMAKVFSDATYQVLTADDVLGRAYGVGGDENLLLSGWVNEKDIEEFENLLQARTGLTSYAMKVGKLAHADIVISGEAKYEMTSSRGPGKIEAKTTNVILSAKALQVDKKKTYHIAIVENEFTAILQANTLKAREKALMDAAAEAGWELLANTPKLKK